MRKTAKKVKHNNLKRMIRNHWENEVCGTRYGRESDEQSVDLEQMARERYRLEPYIVGFADFESA